MRRLFGGDNSFALIDSNSLMKAEPILTVSRLVDEVKSLIEQGRGGEAMKYLSALKDPRAFMLRGVICEARERLAVDVIERYIRSELEQEMLEEAGEGSLQRASNTLLIAHSELSDKEKLSLQKEYISLWVLELGSSYKTAAIKYIPSFVIEYKSGSYEGQWEFPECYVGAFLEMSGEKLVVSRKPHIVYPEKYQHPFVYSSGGICLGSYKGRDLGRMTVGRQILTLMRTAAQVIRSGYNKKKSSIAPANGHLVDDRYRKYKISDKVSDEYLERRESLKETRRIARERGGEN
jgi:hypothetical protein